MKYFKKISLVFLWVILISALSGCSFWDNIYKIADIGLARRNYNTSVDAGMGSDGSYVPDEGDMVNGKDLIEGIGVAELSDEEREGLLRMREEEKLARDVFLVLALQWQEHIFENIANSEQTHTNSIRVLIERYGITDPIMDDSVGVFVSPDMQKLYEDFVWQGRQSVEEAYKVGAAVEELNVHDLSELSEKTDNDDIKAVYAILSKGSRNHLRVFVRQIYSKKETYEPKHLSEEEYDGIVSSPHEKELSK